MVAVQALLLIASTVPEMKLEAHGAILVGTLAVVTAEPVQVGRLHMSLYTSSLVSCAAADLLMYQRYAVELSTHSPALHMQQVLALQTCLF